MKNRDKKDTMGEKRITKVHTVTTAATTIMIIITKSYAVVE